jgi:hypothetical protein
MHEHLAQHRLRFLDEALALHALFVEQARDPLVGVGFDEAKRQIFQLPLELPDTQTVGQRRIKIKRFARQALAHARLAAILLVRGVPAQRLQPRRQTQQHHAQVVAHCQQHAAQGFGLPFSVRLVARAGALRQPHQLAQVAHQRGHRCAEARAHPLIGVAHHVVRAEQIARGQQVGIVAQRPHDLHHAIGMLEIRLAGAQFAIDVQRRHEGACGGRVDQRQHLRN